MNNNTTHELESTGDVSATHDSCCRYHLFETSYRRQLKRYAPLVLNSVWTKMAVFAILARQTADILYSWSTKIPPHVGSPHGERRYNRQEGCFYT